MLNREIKKVEYKIGKRCKGCGAICEIKSFATLAAERENCPCFECLIKVMCTDMCRERDEYYMAIK